MNMTPKMEDMEDPTQSGTVSLHSLGQLGLEEFFPIAIGVTEALAKLHATGKLHGQLSLANIRVNVNALPHPPKPQGNEEEILICLINASNSCNSCIVHYNIDKQTGPDLCFVAPEQTGRMQNRHVDERSDLYSLGIVFYSCLRGIYPFW